MEEPRDHTGREKMKLVWDEKKKQSWDPESKLGFKPFSTGLPGLRGYRVFLDQQYLVDCEMPHGEMREADGRQIIIFKVSRLDLRKRLESESKYYEKTRQEKLNVDIDEVIPKIVEGCRQMLENVMAGTDVDVDMRIVDEHIVPEFKK